MYAKTTNKSGNIYDLNSRQEKSMNETLRENSIMQQYVTMSEI